MQYTSLLHRQLPQHVSTRAILTGVITVMLLTAAVVYLDRHFLYLLLVIASAFLAIAHRLQQFSNGHETTPDRHSKLISTDGGTFNTPDEKKSARNISSQKVVFDGGNFVRINQRQG